MPTKRKHRDEIWKEIKGYENKYEISNTGRVKSLSRKVERRNDSFHIIPEILKKQRVTKNGYATVYLAIGKSYRHFMVHRLVADAFCKKSKQKKFVNHKDGVKLNNHFSNLEWCTDSENKKHAYKIGLMSQKGESHASNKLTNKQVCEIFKSNNSTIELCEKYNVCYNTIFNIRHNRSWIHITSKLKKNDSNRRDM